MHLLICLSYLNREKFKKQVDDTNLVERITDFADRYSHGQQDSGRLDSNVESDAAEVDRKTVLDLCAHMFHMKDEEERN